MVKVVSVEKCEASMGINSMLVTVEGENIDEVLDNKAKQIAYDERLKQGMHSAGIEGSGGPYPVDAKTGNAVPPNGMAEISKRLADLRYRITFKLTQGVI